MQDRRSAEGRPWHGNRAEQRILKQVRVIPFSRILKPAKVTSLLRIQKELRVAPYGYENLGRHRLKTLVKRRIQQDVRSRNFEARNGKLESNIFVMNEREQCRVHKGQEECWQ